MSIFYRAVPLVMAAICLAFGIYIRTGGDTSAHYTAGQVCVALTAICYALFTTAATIIRQIIGRYGPRWRVALPVSGYLMVLATVIWGITMVVWGDAPAHEVAGFVVIGVGLVAACVSTVATASSAFDLIKVSAASRPGAGAPEGAYPAMTGTVLIIIPAACAVVGFLMAIGLYIAGGTFRVVAAHVVFGLALVCTSLIALVASIVRQIRNEYGEAERYRWSWVVVAMGTIAVVVGLLVLWGSDSPARIAPGCVLIALGLICFSILSKVLLLGLVWRRSSALAGQIPIIPVVTALACLFFSAFLSEAASGDPAFFVPARVTAGLGAVCFTLYSIVSILEAGTSGD
ncbi:MULTISPECIES: DUF2776 family protein [Thermomonosporaceae]|uniref:DUF2776 family protein n=1 Tax=Thermomonosporaceae TaxID=2012 RepID=UPI00255AA44C|nr:MULTISPECIES: DUF2776 family protein [Thermomonosporaceae]MDL4775843.1 DUF2776 family protein [Actinomadura xylanilytica]